jgi:hypothetical protein
VDFAMAMQGAFSNAPRVVVFRLFEKNTDRPDSTLSIGMTFGNNLAVQR